MSDHLEFDTGTLAAVWRRMSEAERARFEEVRLSRLFVKPLLPFLRDCLGPDGNGIGNDHEALEVACRHLRDILADRDTDALAAELDRLDAVEGPVAFPMVELPVLRKRPGPHGHDDRRHLMTMRELLRTKKVSSPYAAAKFVLGSDDKDRIGGLQKKYEDWREDGFPTELVAE